MVNSIKSKLIEIRKNALLVHTCSSYTKMLSDMFIKDMDLFHIVCDIYDVTPEELLSLLSSSDVKIIPLLDELSQFCYSILESKEPNKIEYMR